jgi:uncharacterized protein YbjT (DUF2867 family)
MTTNDRVLVVGASGRTGQRTVQALRRHGFAVRALIRDEAQRELVAGDGVEVLMGDVTKEEDLRRALQGVSHVVSALGSKGPTDSAHIELIEYTTIAELAQLAKDAGVQHIVLCSSMGTEIPDMIPPLAEILRQKRRGELAVENSGVPFTIVRPGGLTDEPGGNGVQAARTLHGFGMISRDDVAEVLAQALLQPDAKNKIVEIVSAPDAGLATRHDLFLAVALT